MSEIDELLGKSISLRRRKIGMSLADVADGLKISPKRVAAFENGTERPTAQQIFEIADLLDVEVTGLFDRTFKEHQAKSARATPDWSGIEHLVGHYDVLPKSHRAAIFAFLLALNGSGTENM